MAVVGTVVLWVMGLASARFALRCVGKLSAGSDRRRAELVAGAVLVGIGSVCCLFLAVGATASVLD